LYSQPIQPGQPSSSMPRNTYGKLISLVLGY
jgi:hypothetical protein